MSDDRLFSLLESHRTETREQLARIHERIDRVVEVGERIAALEARYGDIRSVVDAHGERIDELRDNARGAARLAVTGAGAGSAGLLLSIGKIIKEALS
jgi:hypothetical protein